MEISEQSLKNKKLKEEQVRQKQKQVQIDRGYDGFISKKITCYVTYYTNLNNSLQGGSLDKKGISILSHKEPVIAAPSDVKYGSIIIFNEKVNNNKTYKVVDTGGAIRWLDDTHTVMKVDVFVPNVSERWIIKNLENKKVDAVLYTKR